MKKNSQYLWVVEFLCGGTWVANVEAYGTRKEARQNCNPLWDERVKKYVVSNAKC